jgi:hypothetical protein
MALAEVLRLYRPDRDDVVWLTREGAEAVRVNSREPLYALPERMIEVLADGMRGWLSSAELERERQFASLATSQGSLGIFLANPITHGILSGAQLPELTPDILDEECLSGLGTSATARNDIRLASKIIAAVNERTEAYLGWLITNPTFLQECSALRNRWSALVEQADGLPQTAGGEGTRWRELPSAPLPPATAALDDFASFYRRWQLLGMSTWDLPNPIGGNIGGPAAIGPLAGVEHSPTVQLPITLRLPDEMPLQLLTRVSAPEHLAEWETVQEQRHPDGLSYQRLRRIFQLQHLLNVVLRSRYGDRFHRQTLRLDRLFAEYFGDRDEQSVSKLRQWTALRLKPVAR